MEDCKGPQGRFDLVDINFPFCEHCQGGRILPTAVLLEGNQNRHGDRQWSNDQLLVKICSTCGEVEVADRIGLNAAAWFSVE
jgi:hypothetical protein